MHPLDFIQFFRLPVFGWIQVEVSSFCNAECLYCPHTIYKDNWEERLMSIETYKRLIPAFQKTKLVYLQGWGEPFLNPRFFDMVAIAKKAGCDVGTSTNGSLLNPGKIEQLIASGIDLVAFSLAGTGPDNDRHRQGTKLDRILDTIRQLNEHKAKTGRDKPAIHIAYLLLRSGLDELQKLPGLVENLGVDQVVISTLDFVPNDELKNETLIPKDQDEYNHLAGILDDISERASKHGVKIHYGLVSPGHRRSICTENVNHSMFVSSDGEISPCVFTNMPVRSDKAIIMADGETYKRLTFGNIRDNSIASIWRKPEYKKFRDSFVTGEIQSCCRHCPKLMIE